MSSLQKQPRLPLYSWPHVCALTVLTQLSQVRTQVELRDFFGLLKHAVQVPVDTMYATDREPVLPEVKNKSLVGCRVVQRLLHIPRVELEVVGLLNGCNGGQCSVSKEL